MGVGALHPPLARGDALEGAGAGGGAPPRPSPRHAPVPMFIRLRNGVSPMDVMKMMENRLIWLGTMSHIMKAVWKMGASCACAMAKARASYARTSTDLPRPPVDRSGCTGARGGGAGGGPRRRRTVGGRG